MGDYRVPKLRCPKCYNGSLTNPRWQKWFWPLFHQLGMAAMLGEMRSIERAEGRSQWMGSGIVTDRVNTDGLCLTCFIFTTKCGVSLTAILTCFINHWYRGLMLHQNVQSCYFAMMPLFVSEMCLSNGSDNVRPKLIVSIDKRMRKRERDGRVGWQMLTEGSQVPQPKLASGHHGSWGTWLTEGAFLWKLSIFLFGDGLYALCILSSQYQKHFEM